MNTLSLALICPLGQTGAVLTETVDALVQKWIGLEPCDMPQPSWPINDDQKEKLQDFALDIYCPFTSGAICFREIPFPHPSKPETEKTAHFPKYFERYERYPAKGCLEAVHYLEGYKLGYADQAEKTETGWAKTDTAKYITLQKVRLVGIPVQSWKDPSLGELLEDVRSPNDNRCFQNLLYGLHHCLKNIYPTILMSLAGGRKTMSAYGMVSAMMFGKPRDASEKQLPLLSHVLVNDRQFEQPTMYQLPYGAYDLVDVPYFPMTDLVEQVLQEMGVSFPLELSNGEKFSDRFPAQDFLESLKYDDLRSFIYRIGGIYTNRLSDISVEIGKLIQQGIIFRAIKHDVIDPLNKITNPVVKNCYTQINAISRFGRLIDEGDKYHCSLKAIVEKAYKEYIDQHKPDCEFTLTCSFDETLLLKVHSDFIQLLFFNLIKNSFDAFNRYLFQHLKNNEGGDLKLHLSLIIEKNDQKVIVIFQDNAGGIPPEHVSRIFDFGYSTEQSASRGFGLFMCRKIMQSHKGGIVYDSARASGGVFFVLTFPQ
jgi:hypothetical protein